MPSGRGWDDDDPADLPRISANLTAVVTQMAREAPRRLLPVPADALGWHRKIYVGCSVPSATYVGAFRGDPGLPGLLDYEVGIGPTQPDGLPENLGVWADDVQAEVDALFARLHAALAPLDAALPVGQRPVTVDELDAVVQLVATVHGEWVRIHPFANGNGRTARVWAAWLALRYGLPPFVTLKPRPDDIAYARASSASMGRTPDFQGDGHLTAHRVFGHLLSLSLLR